MKANEEFQTHQLCLLTKWTNFLFQEDENKPKSHSPTPILDGEDEDMHDEDLDGDDMGNMSECEGDETLSETKIRLDEDDEGYEEDEQGMIYFDCKGIVGDIRSQL